MSTSPPSRIMSSRTTRTKRCQTAGFSRSRGARRPSGLYPDIVIEPVTGAPPVYQQTMLDSRGTTSALTRHRPSLTAAHTSEASGSQHSTHPRRRTLVDEDTYASSSDHDRDQGGGDDVEATKSNPRGSGCNKSVRGRGPDRAMSPSVPGAGKLIATIYQGKLIGSSVLKFFGHQIKKNVNAFWPRY